MAILRRTIVLSLISATWLVALGFIIFAAVVTRDWSSEPEPADGIVVLTGGPLRIRTGAELLERVLGKRLLISGVNAQTGQADVKRLSGLSAETFSCCVDLGYFARDTVGNALEARTWVNERKYNSIIVVTSSFHMPRSLSELARELPNVRLVPHPVMPRGGAGESWWLDPMMTRHLVAEYLKFLPSAARLAVQRLRQPFRANSIAEANSAGHPGR